MKRQTTFRLETTDDYEQRLHEALRHIAHGSKGDWLVNLTRPLFGNMSPAEMHDTFKKVAADSPEALVNLFNNALHKLRGTETLFPPEKREPPIKVQSLSDVPKKEAKQQGIDFASLSDD